MNLARALPYLCSFTLFACSSSSSSSTNGPGTSSGGAGDVTDVGGSGGAAPTVAHVQDVRDGTIARGTEVTFKGVFITGVDWALGDIWVQEAQGVATASHDYPQYAGIQAFVNPITMATNANVARAKAGDCIDLGGPVGSTKGAPEIGEVDQFVPRDASTCGTPPAPLVIDTDDAFVGIATDADPQTSGDQAGANTAGLNGVLMAVPAVTATFVGSLSLSIPGIGMRVQRTGSDVSLTVFPPFVDSPFSVTQGQTLSLTGIFTNVNPGSSSCGLVPRTVDDIVVGGT